MSAGPNAVPGNWSLGPDGTIATFTPSNPFPDFQQVKLKVTKGVQDLVGRSLTEEIVSSFTTADGTPLIIVSTFPAPNATEVALSTVVRFAYSEALAQAPSVSLNRNSVAVSGQVSLFFPDVAGRLDFRSVQFFDRELFKGFPDGTPREPDVVAQIPTMEGEREIIVVHVEVQTEAKGDFRRRMFEYYALLWLFFDAPVFPIALILRKGPRKGITTSEFVQKLFNREVLRFRYATVALARLSGWEYLEKGPLGAGLAALMQRRRSPTDLDLRVKMLQRVVASELDEAFKIPLVNVIETFFSLSAAERRRFRRLVSREEYREVQDTELTWGDKLELKGMVRGKRETLKRLLTAKFGPLPSALESRIDAFDSAEELDRYLDRVLTASSLAELVLEG